MAAAAVAAAGPIQEGWDGNCNPTTFVVTPPLRKAERNANANGNHQVIRALQGFSVANGRPNAEFSIEIRSRGGGAVTVGVITAASGISNANRPLGNDTMSWGYYTGEGRIVHNNANVHANLRIAEAGAVVVVRLNCAANTVSFFVRGDQGLDPLGAPVPVTPNVELFPAVSLSHHQAEVRIFYTQPYRMQHIMEPPNRATWHAQRHEQITREVASVAHRLNVVIIGAAGSGKSALIQAVGTALTNASQIFMHHNLVVRPSSSHATTSFNCIPLLTNPERKDQGLNLWDTWGWREGDPFQFEQFLQPIFDGVLLSGFPMPKDEAGIPRASHPLYNRHLTPLAAMHACILLISAEQFVDGRLPDPELARLKAIVRYARSHCRSRDPVIVITNADRIDPAVAADPFAVFQSEALDRLVGYVSGPGILEVNRANIFPLRQYFSESAPVPAIGAMSLWPVWVAARQAAMQVKAELRQQEEGAAGDRR